MLAKILFDTDLHKKDTDPESIVGYTAITDLIQVDRIRYIQEHGITHYIHGGDLYDRGFFDTGRSLNDRNLDEMLSTVVNGNAYLCVGNHMFIERDANPELYLIQPNDTYRPLKPFISFQPVFKVVDKLKLGTVQISFMHYNKEEYYVPLRDPDTTFHIAVFHTDKVLPQSFRTEAGYFGESNSTYINNVLAGVDIAFIAHVHVPLGVRSYGNTTMFIPGSAMITKNDEREKHRSVSLPVITINDDCTVTTEMATFSTHIEKLKFHETKRRKKSKTTLTELPKDNFFNPERDVTEALTLESYLTAKGYKQKYINILDAAMKGVPDLYTLINLLAESEL